MTPAESRTIIDLLKAILQRLESIDNGIEYLGEHQ